MIYTANNVSEYLLSLLALASELPKDISLSEVTSSTMSSTISRLKKSKLIKISKKYERIRLKSPEGIERLKEMSMELYYHYMMVSNGHNFNRDEKAVDKLKRFSETVLYFLDCGYQIDNIEIKYQPNILGKVLDENKEKIEYKKSEHFADKNGILDLIDSTSGKPTYEKKFYTNKYLKYGREVTNRLNLSKAMGIAISENNLYCVYNPNNDDTILIKQPEEMLTKLAKEIYKNEYGKLPDNIKRISLMSWDKKPQLNILDIFSENLILRKDESGKKIINLISNKSWKQRLAIGLYGEYKESKTHDGRIDGVPSIELISGSYGKIKIAKELIKKIGQDAPINFICLEEQERGVKEMVKGMNSSVTVLDKEQERVLWDLVENFENYKSYI